MEGASGSGEESTSKGEGDPAILMHGMGDRAPHAKPVGGLFILFQYEKEGEGGGRRRDGTVE